MTVTAAADPVEAPAWSIRPEAPIDIDRIHELHTAAFRRTAEADLVDAIRNGPGFLPELSLVAATEDGSVLGHVLLSRAWCVERNAESPRREVLALAPLAVLPGHAGRGIGSALTSECLRIADTTDEPFVAVLGSPAFYGRFGFVPASEHDIDGPFEAAGDAFQVRPRPGATVMPGTVVYPPMFDTV